MPSSLSLSPTRLASLGPAVRAWLLGTLVLLLFCAQAKGRAIIGFDSRFVLFAQEMLRHGPSLLPTTCGEPYPDYRAPRRCSSTCCRCRLSLPFGRGRLAALGAGRGGGGGPGVPPAGAGLAVLGSARRGAVAAHRDLRQVSLDQMVSALALPA